MASHEAGAVGGVGTEGGMKPTKIKIPGFGVITLRGGVWQLGYCVRGKWYRESAHTDKVSVAIALLKRRWKEVGGGRFIGPKEDKIRIDELFEAVRVDYSNNARRSTKDLEGRIKHLEVAFGGIRAMDVTEHQIERYKQTRLKENVARGKRTTSPATINRELTVLRRAFRLAHRQKRISQVPNIELFEEHNAREGFVEPKEFETLVDNLPNHLKDFCRFAYATGWRKGELQTLKWSDVNREAKTVLLRSEHSKNREPRLLPLVGELAEIIERRVQAGVIKRKDGTSAFSEYVFHRGNGKPIEQFRKRWAAARKKAGLPALLFHDLRRSAVRNMDRGE